MKTCEEKTQSVFHRIEEETEIRRNHNRTVKRVAAPVLSLCLAAVIGFAAWQTGVFQKPPMISDPGESGIPIPNPNGLIQREKMPETVPTHPILRPGDEGYIDPGPEPIRDLPDSDIANETSDPDEPDAQKPREDEIVSELFAGWPAIDAGFCITQWGNKTVLAGLADALEKAPADEVFDILAKPYIDYEFMHEGRTLAEYYSDMCDERNLPEVLAQLLKEGDSLKYGTALYESGAPSGEKWAQSFYEERIAFYGTEILDRYIVNGEFLRDQVQNDLEAAKNAKEATKAYKAAYAAYYQYLVDTMQVSLPADVKGTGGIVLHMTADEFKNFTANKIEAWTFSLDSGSGDDGYATVATSQN